MPRPRRHDAARDVLADPSAAEAAAAARTAPNPLPDQAVVDQAVGMLMAYYGVPSDTARAVLRRWADDAGLALAPLAAGLVEAGSQPSLHPFGTLRRILRNYALDVDARRAHDHG